MKLHRASITYSLVCLCLGFAGQGHAATYTVTDLGTLGAASDGYAINSQGQVAGVSALRRLLPEDDDESEEALFLYDGSMHRISEPLGFTNYYAAGINDSGHVVGLDADRAFVYDGTLKKLGTLGGNLSWAAGINNDGLIVGSAQTSAGVSHAFLYDGVMHDLGTIKGKYSAALGINSLGHVTGYDGDTRLPGRPPIDSYTAFIYDGQMRDLGTLPGGVLSQGNSINDCGEVTGFSSTLASFGWSGWRHAFLYDGTMHDLGTMGLDESFGNDLNNLGHVVGYCSSVVDGGQGLLKVPFLYTREAGMVDLNALVDLPPGWRLISASAINDAGQITGTAKFDDYYVHAFLLTPVPEPVGFAIAFLGALVCTIAKVRKLENRTCRRKFTFNE